MKKLQQSARRLLMIRPTNFGFNPETAENNSFQKQSSNADIQKNALKEFDKLVETLNKAGIETIIINDLPNSKTPDSIFPNNWFSTHSNGVLCLYPMYAPNRRLERKQEIIENLKKRFDVKIVLDFTHYENENKFFEGTGSMVPDRENKIVYACLSPRTNEQIIDDFCEKMNYTKCVFNAEFGNKEIYHTNVMMAVADKYAIVCTNSITNKGELKKLVESLLETNKEIIEISLDQMQHFAGNMLQISNSTDEKFLAMSTQAYNSLTTEQIKKIERYNKILHSDISTIETSGGGSVRCMLAEIFF